MLMVELKSSATIAQLRTLVAVAGATWDATGQAPTAAKETMRRLTGNLVGGGEIVEDYAGREVKLTPLGEELAERARRCLAELQPSSVSGVRFACYPAQFVYAAPVLGNYRTKNDVKVDVVPISDALRDGDGAGLRALLHRRHVDVAIVPSDLNVDGYITGPRLYEWTLEAVTSSESPLWDDDVVELSEVCGHSLAAAPVGHRSRALINASADGLGVVVRIVVDSADPHVLCALPTVSPLVSLLPSDAVHRSRHVVVTPVVVQGKPIGGGYSIAHFEGHKPAAALVSYLHSHWPASTGTVTDSLRASRPAVREGDV